MRDIIRKRSKFTAWKQPDVLVEDHDGAINQGAEQSTAYSSRFAAWRLKTPPEARRRAARSQAFKRPRDNPEPAAHTVKT